MAPVTLYYCSPSAPARCALLVFRNLNLDVNLKIIDVFKKEQLQPDFVKINPQHMVPTIDDNGFILWESRAISQYLVEAKCPESTLYPKDPKERAIINHRLCFDFGTLYIRTRNICFPVYFFGESTLKEECRNQLYGAFDLMNTFLEGNVWFAGKNLTIADLSILATLSGMIYLGANIKPYKNLAAWYERCKSLPGFDENDKGAKELAELILNKLTTEQRNKFVKDLGVHITIKAI